MTIRTRILLAIAGPGVGLLTVFSVAVWAEVRAERFAALDDHLRAAAATLAASVRHDPDGWSLSPNADLALAAWEIRLPDGTPLGTYGPPGAFATERAFNGRFPVAGAVLVVHTATDLGPLRAELSDLIGVLGAVGLALVSIATATGWALSRRIAKPLEEMTRRAEAIRPGDQAPSLRDRPAGDEIDRLAVVLDGAFSRLHEALDGQARFTASAAHELRTPLAIVRTEAEVALRAERTAEEYREALVTVASGARRLQDTLDALLLLARVDEGAPRLERIVDLGEVAGEVVGLPPTDRQVTTGIESALVAGDPQQLEIVVRNLWSNALRHTPPGGRITVTVSRERDQVVLVVADTGSGIPAEALPRLFERFYRVDPHRSRENGGAGLGLSIVDAVVRRHRGRVAVRSELGVGSTFTVTLPVAAGPPGAGPGDRPRPTPPPPADRRGS